MMAPLSNTRVSPALWSTAVHIGCGLIVMSNDRGQARCCVLAKGWDPCIWIDLLEPFLFLLAFQDIHSVKVIVNTKLFKKDGHFPACTGSLLTQRWEA